MNRRMFATGLAVIALAACAPAGNTLSSLPGSRWRLIAMGRSLAGAQPDASPLPAGRSLSLNFDAAGAASGDSGCNSFAAGNVQHGVATLAFGPIAATQRACAEAAFNTAEAQYLQLLGQVRGYSQTGDSLELRNAAGDLILRYVRAS